MLHIGSVGIGVRGKEKGEREGEARTTWERKSRINIVYANGKLESGGTYENMEIRNAEDEGGGTLAGGFT